MRRRSNRLVSNLLVPILVLAGCAAALAQMPTYKLGRTMSVDEIRAWDKSDFSENYIPNVLPDGKELPLGRGTAKEGAKVWAQWCTPCHGADGKYQWPLRTHMPSGGKAPILAGESGAIVRQRQFSTALWDYINRAMPLRRGGTLSADEVYAVTAYLLSLDGIVKESDVLDAKSLPKVRMPHRPTAYK